MCGSRGEEVEKATSTTGDVDEMGGGRKEEAEEKFIEGDEKGRVDMEREGQQELTNELRWSGVEGEDINSFSVEQQEEVRRGKEGNIGFSHNKEKVEEEKARPKAMLMNDQ